MAGDNLQASEKLWEAAVRAVTEAARQRGLSCSDHRELHMAARRLSDETGDASIADRFAIAEKLHANFYHDFMEDHEFDYARNSVRAFVNRVLKLVD